MELQDNVSLADTGIPGGAAIDKLGTGIKNLGRSIVNKAKAKKAKQASDAGHYWGLSAFQKSLIHIPQYVLDYVGGKGITEKMVEQMPVIPFDSPIVPIPSAPPTIEQIIAIDNMIKGRNTVNAGGGIGAAVPTEPASEPKTMATDFKKYIPYILGVLLLAGIIWGISKQAK